MYGHYEVESVLGRGAMGMVYLARDKRIGRKVALKTVHVDEKFDDESEANEFYSRLQREAELCGSLQHPNIVTLYEPGYENNIIAWMATEYIDGESLRDRLRKRKPLPLGEALRIGEDILRGLAFAHSRGIVHRDIKPANILLTSAGDAKIADFGIARPSDSNLTAVGEMLGTPSYMSPEQVRCTAVTNRSDLFSAGAVIYEMVTGIKAFGAADVQSILRNVVESAPRPANEVNPEVPTALAELLKRMLAKPPEDRIGSAGAAADEVRDIRQLVNAAEDVVEELPATSEPLPLPLPPQRPKDEAGISTMAHTPPATSSTPAPGRAASPSTAAGTGLRVTRHPVLRRRMSPLLFFGFIILAVAALGSAAYAIRARTISTPTVTHTPSELQSFDEKRKALATARVLMMAGEYERSAIAYESYLAKYPNSTAALTGYNEAMQALQASKAKAKVTVTASKPSRKKKEPAVVEAPPPEPPKKKRSFWDRVTGRP
jgi:serine/threonine protein kinase